MNGGRAGLALTAALLGALAAGCGMRGAMPPAPCGGAACASPALSTGARGAFAPRDARAPVAAAVLLRLNHEDALRRLVDAIGDPHSPRFRRFLTPAQFDERFAPTPAQQRRVMLALRAAGFRIVRTYADRSLIDVRAPTATIARFFHAPSQRITQAPHVPARLAALVAGVEIAAAPLARTTTIEGAPGAPVPDRVRNVIRNGGFEMRHRHWEQCGNADAAISKLHPYAGRLDALIGSAAGGDPAPRGWSAWCQQVTIPSDATLTAYLFGRTNASKLAQGFDEIGLMHAPGDEKHAIVLERALLHSVRWRAHRWALSKYAGRTYYVFFAVHGTKAHKSVRLFVDDVSLEGSASPTPSPSPTPVGPGPGRPLTGPTYGPDGGWAPRGVAEGLDFPVQHGYDGRGATIGIVVPSALNAGDLTNFLTFNDITQTGTLTQTPVAGGPGSGDRTEATLDAETVAGLAPGADVILYETPDTGNLSILDAYATALSDANADVLDSPFVECESVDATFDAQAERDALEAAAKGMTFVAAGGDTGSACYNGSNVVAGANVPASAPHVLAVGGTDSDDSGAVAARAAWSGDNGFAIGATGGAVSATWRLPSYQSALAGSPASTTHRNLPDISMPAVDDDIFVNGTHELVGGTSWSSAIATALLAESVEICGKLGYANPALYDAYAENGEGSVFLDVTRGSNAYIGFTAYAAKPGYDNASGIGMPYGLRFAAALCGRTTSAARGLFQPPRTP